MLLQCWVLTWSTHSTYLSTASIEPHPQITPDLLRYPVLPFPGFKKRQPWVAVNITASRLSWEKQPLCRLNDTLQLYCTTHQPCALGSMGKCSHGGWCQEQYFSVRPISYERKKDRQFTLWAQKKKKKKQLRLWPWKIHVICKKHSGRSALLFSQLTIDHWTRTLRYSQH